MEIVKCLYKGVLAFQLKTKRFVLTVLPTEGGKIASFKKVGNEKEYLLQNPSKEYLAIDMESDYVKGECCGFDDMFPTIDPVKVKTISGEWIEYPDHGEICRVGFNFEIKEDKFILQYDSTMGYSYQKAFFEEEGKIRINYKITNFSNAPLDVLWAGHCLINAEKGGEVDLEYKDGDLVDVMFDISGKFQPFERIAYKKEYLKTNWINGVKACNKFYFVGKSKDGYIRYKYPSGDTFVMEFDSGKLPYVGIWQNFGNINDSYCIGLEPCTVAYDTVENANKYGQKCIIEPNKSLNFFIKLSTT